MMAFRIVCIIPFLCLTLSGAFSQPASFNLNFEDVTADSISGWFTYEQPNYRSFPDSVTVKSGKYSACIEYQNNAPAYGSWVLEIPQSYSGKVITLSGYIKTENVTEGYAGLWLRLDPQIGFDNMSGRGLTGTQDWTYCSVSLTMKPQETTRIALGGLLVGKGKMWIDDLKITVDKKDFTKAKPFIRETLPAENDHAFDNGSFIDISGLTSTQTQNLKKLGLIWGFLKYYHPTIAAGKLNWDYELFRILPSILAAENPDSIFVNWIKSLGEFKTRPQKSRKEIKQSPDLKWIDALQFSEELTTLLHGIQTAIRPENPYYISLEPGVENPKFNHEAAYAEMKYPDAGFRLLAIFRYWNMIQYYFPYKHLIEEDWKTVLEEFIVHGIEAKNETEYTLILLKMIGRIHDTHANIWNNPECLNRYFGENYAPYEIRFVENNAVVTGNYQETHDLQIGDVILKVNGIPVVTTPYWYNCEPINCIGCQGEPYVEMEFTVDETYVMAGDSVRFSNLSDSAYSNFTWKFYGADTFSVAHANPGYVVYPTPGKYKVTLIGEKDFTWDSLSRQRYIVVDSIAPYTFSEMESEYCTGDSLTLEMQSVYLGKINWIVTRNNVLEMLEVGTVLHIDSLESGAYVIRANCRYYDRDTTIFFDTVFVETCPEERLQPDAANQQDEEGISNLLQLATVNLYPNPSPGGFTLEADFPMREILIYGLDGRIVQTYAEKAPKNQVQIGMDNTSAGTYLVKILFDNGFTQILRFIRI